MIHPKLIAKEKSVMIIAMENSAGGRVCEEIIRMHDDRIPVAAYDLMWADFFEDNELCLYQYRLLREDQDPIEFEIVITTQSLFRHLLNREPSLQRSGIFLFTHTSGMPAYDPPRVHFVPEEINGHDLREFAEHLLVNGVMERVATNARLAAP